MTFNPGAFGRAIGVFVTEECKRQSVPDDPQHVQLIARCLVEAAAFMLKMRGFNDVQQSTILVDAVGRATKLPVAVVEVPKAESKKDFS